MPVEARVLKGDSMKRSRFFIVQLLLCSVCASLAAAAASADDGKGPSRSDCANYNLPIDERLVRSCDAQYGLCAKPTAAWSRIQRLVQTCAQIAREKRLSSTLPGAPLRTDLVAPQLLGKRVPTAPSNGSELTPRPMPAAVSR
jgi:hypothetical protein